jgi:hypothetical protein
VKLKPVKRAKTAQRAVLSDTSSIPFMEKAFQTAQALIKAAMFNVPRKQMLNEIEIAILLVRPQQLKRVGSRIKHSKAAEGVTATALPCPPYVPESFKRHRAGQSELGRVFCGNDATAIGGILVHLRAGQIYVVLPQAGRLDLRQASPIYLVALGVK